MLRAFGWVGCLVLSGCGESTAAPRHVEEERVASPTEVPSGDAHVGGDVVATVDGIPITVREVEALAREAHLSPQAALRELEDELVLSRAAERAGLAAAPEVADETRRAAVRALLHRVIEPAHTPEAVTDAEIEARRQEIASGLSAPETRRASHVLVQIPRDASEARVDAAMRLARQIRDELTTEADPASALDRHTGHEGAFDLLVEHLDPMAREQLVAPFADALFGAAAPGLLPEPVRTSYGVHVVVLEEVIPPWEVPREEWEPALRRQLAAEARAAATEALVSQLAEQTPVSVSTQVQPLLDRVTFDDGARGDAPGGGS
jgi:parvulin-like peptidyl-prolyl isomerase